MTKKFTSKNIMWTTIIIAIVLIAVIFPLTNKSFDTPANRSQGADEADVRIQPVARIAVADAGAAAAAGPKDGPTVYNSVCGACHNTGAAGAPKLEKSAWAARLGGGKAALYNSAINGKNAMPPKGGAAALSDDEIKAAVDYMLGKL